MRRLHVPRGKMKTRSRTLRFGGGLGGRGHLPPFFDGGLTERLGACRAQLSFGSCSRYHGAQYWCCLLTILFRNSRRRITPGQTTTNVFNLRAGLAAQAPHLVGNFSQADSKMLQQSDRKTNCANRSGICHPISTNAKEHNEAFQTTRVERIEVKKEHRGG